MMLPQVPSGEAPKNAAAAEKFREAVSLFRQDKLEPAKRLYEAVLSGERNHFASLHHLGLIHQAQGRSKEALQFFRAAVDQNRSSAEAHCNLGAAFQALNRNDEAIASYRQALALRPDYAEAHSNCGNAFLALKRFEAAFEHYVKAIRLKADYADGYYNFGVALQVVGRHQDAVRQYEKALSLRPDYAEAHNNIGSALQALRRSEAALAHFRAAVELKSDYVQAHYNYGVALATLGRHAEAMERYEAAIALNPLYAEAHFSLGTTLVELGRLNEAVPQFLKALALKPDNAEARNRLGSAYQALGNLDGARKNFDLAISIEPSNARYYRNLVNCCRLNAGDPRLVALERLAETMPALGTDNQIQLHFALGKALADVGRHEASFTHFLRGNALHRQRLRYGEAANLQTLARIRAVFTQELLRGKRGLGEPSSVPVFIVGMPRSGTTLIEQILASHSQVFGAGELLTFGKTVAQLHELGIASMAFPEVALAASGDQLRRLGSAYLDHMKALAPKAQRVTDKMVWNFQFVGLIHLALPNARIIHVRRNPIDTCLSCFSILFQHGVEQSYDLGELGRYYKAYETLMEHWRLVIPEGIMLEIDYEDVVADTEGQARGIVAHCGIDWEDSCLSFHKTQRPVQTASAVQVRQPIYRTSVGRSRRYEAFLTPLFDALDIARPDANSAARNDPVTENCAQDLKMLVREISSTTK